MESLFNTIYGWTIWYSQELDNYLYEAVQGYLHNGLVMVITSFVICMLFYYVFKPVRRQIFWWFMYFAIDAIINFLFAIYYTMTPLVNNEISSEDSWTNLDCIFFGISDILWAFIAFAIFSLLFKWWSPCKYVPFVKF
jgi:hypothetical protein